MYYPQISRIYIDFLRPVAFDRFSLACMGWLWYWMFNKRELQGGSFSNPMKIAKYPPALCLLALAGCNSGTMTQRSYNGVTGESAVKNYSKYYDAGAWLVPKHLGISVVVDHEKASVPIVSSVQQSLGALGPGDSYANGKVTVYLWNFDARPHTVKIVRVVLLRAGEEAIAPGKVMNAPPRLKSGDVVGNLTIFNYGTELPLRVEYEVDGTPGRVELKLPRRTTDEIEKYFGESGRPPYPWYGGMDWPGVWDVIPVKQ